MKVIILFFLVTLKLFSQDLDDIKSQDTIYIILKETDSSLIKNYKNFTLHSYGNGVINDYQFSETNNKVISVSTQIEKNKIQKDNLIVRRKKFLINNKSKIIDLEFVEKHGLFKVFIETLTINRKSKIVYIINENDLKKRKIVLKKAHIVDIGYTEM